MVVDMTEGTEAMLTGELKISLPPPQVFLILDLI
ncbi:hypothetical protein AZE42_11640 [Rhizopogon vesiculosus]|uniref:Uncharacterized protein n=1 Tax=Rhizopogon vesiculosus TaxID=180088 RepID=A0A1J8QQB4_9AGAM|nr:hypothetical protein AZE42_11640 [Rhizopogon vesiculosus]